MKNLFFILSFFLLISCKEIPRPDAVSGETSVAKVNDYIYREYINSDDLEKIEMYEVDYKEHTYIGNYQYNGNLSLTHAGHCKCNIKNQTNEKVVYDTVSVPLRTDTIVRYIRQVH